MSDRTPIVLLALVVAYVAKQLAQPMLRRLGQRIADWMLPADRHVTYRLARCLASIAWGIAPSRSSERGAALAVMGEIEELAGEATPACSPVTLALSLVRPALGARLVEIAWALAAVLGFMAYLPFVPVLLWTFIPMVVTSAAFTGMVIDSDISSGERLAAWGAVVVSVLLFFVGVTFALLRHWVVACALGIPTSGIVGWTLLFGVGGAVAERLERRRFPQKPAPPTAG